jgi:ureidoglycolate lyase
MAELRVRVLDRDAFAPFGDVIETDGRPFDARNAGTAQRFGDLARVDLGGGPVAVGIFRSRGRELPVAIDLMERHPLGSQLFMPLGRVPYLVVVGLPTGGPAPGPLDAFWVPDGRGVNYRPGTWHLPLCPIGAGGDFLTIERGGDAANCDIHRYDDASCPVVRRLD